MKINWQQYLISAPVIAFTNWLTVIFFSKNRTTNICKITSCVISVTTSGLKDCPVKHRITFNSFSSSSGLRRKPRFSILRRIFGIVHNLKSIPIFTIRSTRGQGMAMKGVVQYSKYAHSIEYWRYAMSATRRVPVPKF